MENRIKEKVLIWAAKAGWKTVALAITEKHYELVGGKIDPGQINTLIQRIKRLYTLDTPAYQEKRKTIAAATLAALPAKKRLEVTDPFCCELKISAALESFGNAMAAISLKCPTAASQLARTISKLESLYPIVQMFS